MKKNNFYQISELSQEKAEILIFGDITSYAWYEDDVCAYDMAKELQGLNGKKLDVRINSRGGAVDQGLAIYNLLKSYDGEVTTICEGYACSAASVIFMAGSNRLMRMGSLLLIHNAWSYAAGDANALRKTADDLEKITQPSIEIYKSVSTLDESTIKSMMDKEEWILPSEALEYGFATEIVEQSANQAINDNYIYNLVVENKELKRLKEELQKQVKPTEKTGWFFKR